MINGYKFSAINCGIKNNQLDLGLIYCLNETNCVCAFTKNLLKSNSILVSEKNLKKTFQIKAIIANSGCANTACGNNELKNTFKICNLLAKKLKIKTQEVLIASTGVIGTPLPFKKIIKNLDTLIYYLNDKKNSIINFAKSIMTTDKKPKIVKKTLKIKNQKINILCIAKGAGMISPNLEIYDNKSHATMLVFLLTDIWLPVKIMKDIMNQIIIPNFNSFLIDGDNSPNDTIFFLANKYNIKKLTKIDIVRLKKYINLICRDIILKLLFDGEGVNKVVKIIIKNCNKKDAFMIFKNISKSLLVKTAIHGADPNWGRILSSCTSSGVKLDLKKIKIWIGKNLVVKNGTSNFIPDSKIRNIMLKNFYEIRIDLGKNKNKKIYNFYTTDISKKYIEINSKYKT